MAIVRPNVQMVSSAYDGTKFGHDPRRDIAHLYPFLLLALLDALEHDGLLPLFEESSGKRIAPSTVPVSDPRWAQYRIKLETSDHYKALNCLADAFELALDPDVHSPFAAMKKSGFLDFDRKIQDEILTRLAAVSYGGFWNAIRCATLSNEVPCVITFLSRRASQALREFEASRAQEPANG